MRPADIIYHSPYGDKILRRYPTRRIEPLQAWCAADTLLLEAARHRAVAPREVLVVNDSHGALCASLGPLTLWTDSALSARALRRNEKANGSPPTPVCWSTAQPPAAPLTLLRVPKSLAYLEYQLYQLSRLLAPGAVILAAGMDKHLSPHTATVLERYIGPTERHPGRHKARLFTAVRAGHSSAPPGTLSYHCDFLGQSLRSLPNVFSPDQLDGGSKLLIEQLSRLEPVHNLLDLACGNGVMGLAAYRAGLARQVTFCDESAMAVDSARDNARRLFAGEADNMTFVLGDGVSDYRGRAGLVLCNPPFHLDHTVDEFAGRRLIKQCARHLEGGGALCLVANRHLNYRPLLQRHFKHLEQLAADRRFVVYLARH